MPVPYSLEFSTQWNIEGVKQYKDQETFTANNVSHVKVQITSDKIMREKLSVNYEAVTNLLKYSYQ